MLFYEDKRLISLIILIELLHSVVPMGL